MFVAVRTFFDPTDRQDLEKVHALQDAITDSVHRMIEEVQKYVPGYVLKAEPQYDEPRPGWEGKARVAIFLEVAGNGDYLPTYAGNLDIMTAAAARAGQLLAERILERKEALA